MFAEAFFQINFLSGKVPLDQGVVCVPVKHFNMHTRKSNSPDYVGPLLSVSNALPNHPTTHSTSADAQNKNPSSKPRTLRTNRPFYSRTHRVTPSDRSHDVYIHHLICGQKKRTRAMLRNVACLIVKRSLSSRRMGRLNRQRIRSGTSDGPRMDKGRRRIKQVGRMGL